MEGSDDEADHLRKAERERKKAEVRKRLEEAGRVKKAKKGFLTPERKMKLRKLLMLKATEDLKLQQQKKAEERQQILNDRITTLPPIERLNKGQLIELAKDYQTKVLTLESQVYDLNYTVRQKDFEINEVTIAVNDLRGKFVRPSLKRISKTGTQFDKLKKQNEAKIIDNRSTDYRSTLKLTRRRDDGRLPVEEDKAYEKQPEWFRPSL